MFRIINDDSMVRRISFDKRRIVDGARVSTNEICLALSHNWNSSCNS